MDIRKVEGLVPLLESLSLQQTAGAERISVFPAHKYSKDQDKDIEFYYAPDRCKFSTLRRLILQAQKDAGHVATGHLADVMALLFVLMPKSGNVIDDFEKLLRSFVDADVSQYFFIPASSLLRVRGPEETTHDIIGLFGHGPFQYEPLAGDLLEKIRYRLKRLGQLDSEMDDVLKKLFGDITVYREPHSTKVLDLPRRGFRGHQPHSVATAIGYYFDDLAEALFEAFWREHLESQYFTVVAGADLLDRTLLESLPGTAWLTIFWGFELLSGNGMISFIREETHLKDTVAFKIYLLREGLLKARERRQSELGSEAGSVFPSLVNFARLVSRSRELQNRGYDEESFTLLMVALESLLSEHEAIAESLSRRVGALMAISENMPFGEAVRSVHSLYDYRSRFVHQGNPIPVESLKSLHEICQKIFFFACRSQCRCTDTALDKWQQKWLSQLDDVPRVSMLGLQLIRECCGPQVGQRTGRTEP